MSRSIRKETSSLAFGMVGRFGGSSAGFVVAALNAASAASREVVVLRVLSAGIFVLTLALRLLQRADMLSCRPDKTHHTKTLSFARAVIRMIPFGRRVRRTQYFQCPGT